MFYAGLNIVALVLIFFFVPETKQLTLEELDAVFAMPHGEFISYQTKEWLPYFIKRYVLFQKDVRLEPLFKLDEKLVGTAVHE